MYINKADMSLMDISRFVGESKAKRKYKDYVIETENYALLKIEEYQRLLENSGGKTENDENLEIIKIINNYMKLIEKRIYNTELDKFGMITGIEIGGIGIRLKAYYDRIHSSETVLFENFKKGIVKFTIITGESILTEEETKKYREKITNDIKQAFGDNFSDDMIMYIDDDERKKKNKENENREIQKIGTKMINFKKLLAEIFYDNYLCTEAYEKYTNEEITETEMLYIVCNHLCEETKRLKDENLNYFIEKFRREQAEFLIDYAEHRKEVDRISENRMFEDDFKEELFKILDNKTEENNEVSENEPTAEKSEGTEK